MALASCCRATWAIRTSARSWFLCAHPVCWTCSNSDPISVTSKGEIVTVSPDRSPCYAESGVKDSDAGRTSGASMEGRVLPSRQGCTGVRADAAAQASGDRACRPRPPGGAGSGPVRLSRRVGHRGHPHGRGAHRSRPTRDGAPLLPLRGEGPPSQNSATTYPTAVCSPTLGDGAFSGTGIGA